MIDARTWPRGDRGFAKAVALPPQMQKPVSDIQPFRFVSFVSFNQLYYYPYMQRIKFYMCLSNTAHMSSSVFGGSF